MAVSRSKTKSRSFTKASPIISRSHSPKEMTRKVSIPTPHSSIYRIQHRKRQIDLSPWGLAAEKVGVGSGSVKVRILPSRYFSHCRRWHRVAGKNWRERQKYRLVPTDERDGDDGVRPAPRDPFRCVERSRGRPPNPAMQPLACTIWNRRQYKICADFGKYLAILQIS